MSRQYVCYVFVLLLLLLKLYWINIRQLNTKMETIALHSIHLVIILGAWVFYSSLFFSIVSFSSVPLCSSALTRIYCLLAFVSAPSYTSHTRVHVHRILSATYKVPPHLLQIFFSILLTDVDYFIIFIGNRLQIFHHLDSLALLLSEMHCASQLTAYFTKISRIIHIVTSNVLVKGGGWRDSEKASHLTSYSIDVTNINDEIEICCCIRD